MEYDAATAAADAAAAAAEFDYDTVVNAAATAAADAAAELVDAIAAADKSRVAGRADVTANPGNFNLKTNAAYATVVAERDARFVDTDRDGLTDVKEIDLATDRLLQQVSIFREPTRRRLRHRISRVAKRAGRK